MRFWTKLVLSILVSFLLSSNEIFARSGCCSHHGGVCGCGCCDGTSLSDTCAPYYPECYQVVPTYDPIPVLTVAPIVYTPIPALVSTPVPTITIYVIPSPSVVPTVIPIVIPTPTQTPAIPTPQVQGVSTQASSPRATESPTVATAFPTVKASNLSLISTQLTAGEKVGVFSVGFVPFGIIAWVVWRKSKR